MNRTQPSFYFYIILGLIIGLVAGYASTTGLPGLPGAGWSKTGRGHNPAAPGPGSGVPAAPQPPLASADSGMVPQGGVRTAPYTLIIFREENPACRESLTRSRSAGTELAGLDRTAFQERFPGWRVEDFRPAQVILRRLTNEPCQRDEEYRTISIYDSRVAVFAGRPGHLGPMLQDTGIEVERLLPADREKLMRGVVVRGDSEVWQFLEGLEMD